MGLILCVVGPIVVVSAILFGYWLSQKNLVKSKNTWQNWDIKIGKAQNELSAITEEYQQVKEEYENTLSLLSVKSEAVRQTQQQLSDTQTSLAVIQDALEKSRSYQEVELQNHQKDLEEKLLAIDKEHDILIGDKQAAFKLAMDEYDRKLESKRSLYLAAVAAIQNGISEEEKDIKRHINIDCTAQEDIDYLLNNVIPKLRNPDILYKLIWSEYIQKNTNEMLDYILPNRDCSGIYKITNDITKQAYIGRSTSVRKRLTDHVKSSVGISTIADQRVHKAMREEGIWNFTFELIEECPREQLNEREKYYIQFFSTEQMGYNQKAGG